jgi:hypothetical protein
MQLTALLMLILSTVVLALAPLLHLLLQRRRALRLVLDAFVMVTIGAIVLLHIAPMAVRAVGWVAVPAVALGLLGVDLLERLTRGAEGSARRIRAATLLTVVVGLLLHTMIDGMGLSVGYGHHHAEPSPMLPIGVVVHRLPIGLMVWMAVRPAAGARVAVAAIAAMCGSTVAGFFLGERLAGFASNYILVLFQAFVGGTLLHVVLHRLHRGDGAEPTTPRRTE